MHIPDGILDPRIAAATSVLGGLGFAYAARKLERTRTDQTPVLLGTTAAFLFAGQMVNFPVGPGVSGHLLGGVLAASLLGPWGGMIVIAAVLTVQCLLFGDGGLTALGANFLNMGVVGAAGGYAILTSLRQRLGGPRGLVISAMLAAWLSVILASGAFAIELGAAGRSGNFLPILAWMSLVHAAIGMGEAVITGLVLRAVLVRRPELAGAFEPLANGAPAGRKGLPVAAAFAVALAVAIFLAPFASEWPDGLEFVGEKLGFLANAAPAPIVPAPLAEYQVSWLGLEGMRVATAIAGVVGTLVVFGVAWGLSRALPAADRREVAAHAA